MRAERFTIRIKRFLQKFSDLSGRGTDFDLEVIAFIQKYLKPLLPTPNSEFWGVRTQFSLWPDTPRRSHPIWDALRTCLSVMAQTTSWYSCIAVSAISPNIRCAITFLAPRTRTNVPP